MRPAFEAAGHWALSLLRRLAGVQRKFCVTSGGIFELQKAVPKKPQSWFVGDKIHSGKALPSM